MKTCFFNSGFKFKNFKGLDNRNAKEKSELISEAEVVILAGGHVPTQNIFFQQINLKNELKTSNKIIIGFSAGSMNGSEEVYAQPELQGESLDQNYKRFLKGLGITKSQILPHYNLIKNEYLDGKRLFEEITYTDSFGRAFITLNDGCYLYGGGQYEIVYGESFIISDEQLENVMKNVQATAKELIEKIDIELEKYVAPVPKKSMTMKERIDKAKTKLSEKKPQETELKNDKLSNHKIKGENE